jgi:adenylate cyclase
MAGDDGEPGEVEGAPDAAQTLGLALLALDRRLFPRQLTYTASELADKAGVDLESAERLWRSMGFTAGSHDDPIFFEDDLEALRSAVRALDNGTDLDQIVYQTRVMAAALARAAEVSSDGIVGRIEQLRQAGIAEEQIADMLTSAEEGDMDRLVGYFYRRQLKAALWRRLAVTEHLNDKATMTVGFVDLVRFTAITEDIAEEQLGELIDRFESVAHERVTTGGGRIVKGADEAIDIAMELVHDFGEDQSVPNARAGLASGSVLAYGGDYFGPVVNLAARIVDIARPSTVVVSPAAHDLLAKRADLNWRRLPPKRLKGIGRVSPWAASHGPARRSRVP